MFEWSDGYDRVEKSAAQMYTGQFDEGIGCIRGLTVSMVTGKAISGKALILNWGRCG